MSQISPTPPRPDESAVEPTDQRAARSFGEVADAYDRARPTYPPDGVAWLVGSPSARVLELGAGTGKLTEVLQAAGHQVLAIDPLAPMLQRLARRTSAVHVVARAEQLPVASRSVDVVVCGQSFHWFDHDLALPEIARVLRPGGVLAVACNTYDDSIPWVRRLHKLLNPTGSSSAQEVEPLMATPFFGFVDEATFRVWQHHTSRTLDDLARSTSHVATLPQAERDDTLARIRSLYDDYGRGPDGMKLPYLTRCYRAVVRHDELPPEQPLPTRSAPRTSPASDSDDAPPAPASGPPEDPGISLIDFR